MCRVLLFLLASGTPLCATLVHCVLRVVYYGGGVPGGVLRVVYYSGGVPGGVLPGLITLTGKDTHLVYTREGTPVYHLVHTTLYHPGYTAHSTLPSTAAGYRSTTARSVSEEPWAQRG